ncbi:hypothetical protein DL89DRAFT_265428 [Linderina pennispora]|uniref:Mid2 domain-containing protein n=1 Tax=Linderina pennispora TaxID=61395 RepID=A0A1Y1WID9_9FUNG|nr:uncharacterized protein DL89DRAFT_265428 [Linderina pennispora]ORX73340.1 hypothetical protein DL89DRAFT_265428 [Linderina pennispora]
MVRSSFLACCIMYSLVGASAAGGYASPAPNGSGKLEARQNINAMLSSALVALNTLLDAPTSSAVATGSTTQTPTTRDITSSVPTGAPDSIDFGQLLSQAGEIANSLFGGIGTNTAGPFASVGNSSDSGMSSGTKIALGVAIPLGAILIGVVVFLYIKLKKHRYDRDLAYEGENAQVVHQLGGAGDAIVEEEVEEQPPSYSNLPENRVPASK